MFLSNLLQRYNFCGIYANLSRKFCGLFLILSRKTQKRLRNAAYLAVIQVTITGPSYDQDMTKT